jgi:nitronate monooxygenase
MTQLRTPLCDLLGIDVPLAQSGMGRVAGPDLVAAVCEAGGLGILAGLNRTAAELRDDIWKVRSLTRRPFGVNLWLHTELDPPVPPSSISDETLARVQGVLNEVRKKIGLPESHERPATLPDLVDEAFEVILDERVPVFSVGLGDPGLVRTRRCHERGIKVVAMVATVDDARTVAAAGVDVIVAQGGEAGGHRSTWVKKKTPEHASIGTMALVPQVVDAVSVPVIAAGGIADGRGLVSALALGAAGVMLGTRFVATREAVVPEIWKKALVERGSDDTMLTDAFTGLFARALRNDFTETYAASGAPVLPTLLQANVAFDIFAKAAMTGDARYFPLWAGQSTGLVRDVPGAGDVVRTIMAEAIAALEALRNVQRD